METKNYRLIKGQHHYDGRVANVGDMVPLTPKQYASFRDKFERADSHGVEPEPDEFKQETVSSMDANHLLELINSPDISFEDLEDIRKAEARGLKRAEIYEALDEREQDLKDTNNAESDASGKKGKKTKE